MNQNPQEIEFPVEWHYKIICLKDDPSAQDEITKVLRTHKFDQQPEMGQESKKGKYQTYKVTVEFQDIETMRSMSSHLSSLPCVKFLI